jgi:hypothetical protein
MAAPTRTSFSILSGSRGPSHAPSCWKHWPLRDEGTNSGAAPMRAKGTTGGNRYEALIHITCFQPPTPENGLPCTTADYL